MPLHNTFMGKIIVSATQREKKLFLFMLIQCQIILVNIINNKSLRTMEAVQLYTRQVVPSLKPVNVNYFLSVKNMLEEGLLANMPKLHWIPQYVV